MEILHGAGINVISSQSLEMDEYAFVVNDDITTAASTFTENQAGEPVSAGSTKQRANRAAPADIRRAGAILCAHTAIEPDQDRSAGRLNGREDRGDHPGGIGRHERMKPTTGRLARDAGRAYSDCQKTLREVRRATDPQPQSSRRALAAPTARFG